MARPAPVVVEPNIRAAPTCLRALVRHSSAIRKTAIGTAPGLVDSLT